MQNVVCGLLVVGGQLGEFLLEVVLGTGGDVEVDGLWLGCDELHELDHDIKTFLRFEFVDVFHHASAGLVVGQYLVDDDSREGSRLVGLAFSRVAFLYLVVLFHS